MSYYGYSCVLLGMCMSERVVPLLTLNWFIPVHILNFKGTNFSVMYSISIHVVTHTHTQKIPNNPSFFFLFF